MAYQTPFLGKAAQRFLEELGSAETKAREPTSTLYAKGISVVQSSGTGKSRMLTEVSVFGPVILDSLE
jgi:hypothetical protein